MAVLLAEGGSVSAIVAILLGIMAALGLLALVSPSQFATLAARGGYWVDTNKLFAFFDKRIDIDAYVLPFSRVFGVIVLGAAVLIAWLIRQY